MKYRNKIVSNNKSKEKKTTWTPADDESTWISFFFLFHIIDVPNVTIMFY